MTIDDRLAFGEHVSLPIRTEKAAEEKWIELKRHLNAMYSQYRLLQLSSVLQNKTSFDTKPVYTMRGLRMALDEMDRLDRT